MKKEVVWVDPYGEKFTLEELVDDFLLTRAINQGLHKLLLAHKVPLRDLVNAEHIAKNKHYGVKNVKPEKTQPAKKAPAKKKKSLKVKTKEKK